MNLAFKTKDDAAAEDAAASCDNVCDPSSQHYLPSRPGTRASLGGGSAQSYPESLQQ